MKRTTVVSSALFAAWAVHDMEELLTMPGCSRQLLAHLPEARAIPEQLRREGLSHRHVRVAISLMGVMMALAATEGVRTDARSPLFQTVLACFGWHGVGHLAASALTGRYTSGVLTSPVIVLPYWLWARRELTAAGVELRRIDPRLLPAMYPLFIGVQLLAHRLTAADSSGERRSTRRRPATWLTTRPSRAIS